MWSYVDTSAAVKLLLVEAHSDEVRDWLTGRELVTSALTQAEMLRAVRRNPHTRDQSVRVDRTLATWMSVDVTDTVLRRAGMLDPSALRTLDAIHLATAERLAPELEAFVTYDQRLAEAAMQLGLRVVSPGT